VRILAISWASHTEVNRQIFRVLSAAYNLEVTIIIPRSINIDGVPVGCDHYADEDIDIIALDVTSGNPRFNRYIGINSVIAKIKPDIIFHEDDPISLQAIQYGLLCRLYKAKLICRTNQNTDISYAYEIKRLGFLKGALYAGMKLSMFSISRRLISHIFSISEDGSRRHSRLMTVSVRRFVKTLVSTILFLDISDARLKERGFTCYLKHFQNSSSTVGHYCWMNPSEIQMIIIIKKLMGI